MKPVLVAGISGLLFALGLGLGGMTEPSKVVAFLDVAGAWNPSLLLVMAGATGSFAALRPLVLRRRKPVFAPAFPKFGHARVNARLLMGAGLFGAGWGLSGYCPGPAFTSLATGTPTIGLFVGAMAAGMVLFGFWERATVQGQACR